MSGYAYGFHDQNLDLRTRRKIEELRSKIRYIKVLQTNDKAVFNIPVSEWLEKSESVLNEIDGSHIEDRIDKKFRKGFLRQHRYASLRLGIATDKISKEVNEQLERSSNALRGYKRISSTADHVVIGSEAEDAYKNIQQKLCEVPYNGARIMRVSGRPGVGKTAVVSKINNYVLEGMTREGASAIDNVFWVSVSPSAALADLQQEIANRMRVDYLPAAADDEERAKTLLNALKKNRVTKWRNLIILDLWKDLSLDEIGIPEPSPENGFKILVICRTMLAGGSLKNNCRGYGVVDYEIKGLSEIEINVLFTNIVGDPFKRLPEKTWRMLLEECDCSPTAIVNIGQAIRSNMITTTDISSATTKAMVSFEFSNESLHYNFLSLREETRPFFFYCALFPSPPNDLIETEELIRCWIWDGLMGDVEGTGIVLLQNVNDKIKKGKKLLEEIKNRYLLEIVNEEYVKMNKSVRDMAAHVGTQYCFFLKVGNGKKDSKRATEIVERASVMSDQLEELGREPKIKLSTLVVRNQLDHNQLSFPARLFDDTPNIKVLDLCGTHIKSFPNNFSGLKNLRALRLYDCLRLTSLPEYMSSFPELLVLDLSGASIQVLPSELNTLTKLLRLDISGTPMRKFPFPLGLLTMLTGLQELLMMSSYLWTGEEAVDDLKSLTKLAHLEANFSNLQALRCFVDSAERGCFPPKFRFCVGNRWLKQSLGENALAILIDHIPSDDTGSLVSLPSCKVLHFMLNKNLKFLPLQGTSTHSFTEINVSDCEGLLYLFQPNMMSSVPNLRKIVVKRCEKMIALIQEPEDSTEEIHLASLQELVCFNLEKLERISNGPIKCKSLKSISVWDCDQLSSIATLHGRENNPIELTGQESWLGQIIDEQEMLYKKVVQDSAPQDFYTRPAYTDITDGQKEKPSPIAFMKSLVSSIVPCKNLLSAIYKYYFPLQISAIQEGEHRD